MEEILLEAQPRQDKGRSKTKKLRSGGFIPAVVYGEGKTSQSIQISSHTFLQLLHEKKLDNAIITLKIKEGKKHKNVSCLIKDIQLHPVHENIIHIDFYEVSLTKAIKVNVPVVAKGEPVGVKQDGGSLEHILWEVEVECLPTDIPKQIQVDVSGLKIGDSIHVKDLPVPPNTKIINDPEATVISVAAPMKEEAVVTSEEAAGPQEPEVIKEKKETSAESSEEKKE